MATWVIIADSHGNSQHSCVAAQYWAKETADFNSKHIDALINSCSSEGSNLARHLTNHVGESSGQQRFFSADNIQVVEEEEKRLNKRLRNWLGRWQSASSRHGLHELGLALQDAGLGKHATRLVQGLVRDIVTNQHTVPVQAGLVTYTCKWCAEHIKSPTQDQFPYPRCVQAGTGSGYTVENLRTSLDQCQLERDSFKQERDKCRVELQAVKDHYKRKCIQNKLLQSQLERFCDPSSQGTPAVEESMDDRDPLPHMAELERSQQTESEMRPDLDHSMSQYICPQCENEFNFLSDLQLHVLDCIT